MLLRMVGLGFWRGAGQILFWISQYLYWLGCDLCFNFQLLEEPAIVPLPDFILCFLLNSIEISVESLDQSQQKDSDSSSHSYLKSNFLNWKGTIGTSLHIKKILY